MNDGLGPPYGKKPGNRVVSTFLAVDGSDEARLPNGLLSLSPRGGHLTILGLAAVLRYEWESAEERKSFMSLGCCKLQAVDPHRSFSEAAGLKFQDGESSDRNITCGACNAIFDAAMEAIS